MAETIDELERTASTEFEKKILETQLFHYLISEYKSPSEENQKRYSSLARDIELVKIGRGDRDL